MIVGSSREELGLGDSVGKLVSGYIEALEGRPGGKAGKPVAFSIRLSEKEHARLLWLAKSLGAQKTPLAEKLLGAAVEEAIEQYARWASPEDPEGFFMEAREEIEGLERDPKAHHGPGRPGRKPHGGPPGPKRPG